MPCCLLDCFQFIVASIIHSGGAWPSTLDLAGQEGPELALEVEDLLIQALVFPLEGFDPLVGRF